MSDHFAPPGTPRDGTVAVDGDVASSSSQHEHRATARPEGEPGASADDSFAPPPAGTVPGDYAVPAARPRDVAVGTVRARTIALVAVGSVVLGGLAGLGSAVAYDAYRTSGAALPPAVVQTGEQPAPGSVAAVAAAVMPSVVQIEAFSGGSPVDTGSGFVIRADGYILTNNHVVEPSDGQLQVLFSDGTREDATLVGRTAEYDLAVVKVKRDGLTPLVLGDSEAMEVGDPVIAIGSPLGLDSTVTTGIVSALHRPVTTSGINSPAFIDALQTDAAINPGNSGGPLLNFDGEVIGINSAVAALPGATQTSGAGSVGLGFAIPSNQARRTAQELIDTGHATFPVIGVVLDRTYNGEGVKVASSGFAEGTPGVVPGSPADRAGIREGDVITAFDGRPVTQADTLIVGIRAKAPGDTVTFTIVRDGKEQQVSVTLTSSDDVDFGDGGSSQ